jgi:hypothetical protein
VTSSTIAGIGPAARSDRRRIAAAIGALAVVLVAVVSVRFVLGGGTIPEAGTSPPTGAGSGASANPDPSAYPNADEAALIALLPPDIGERCRRGSYESVFAVSGASARPLASLDCTLPGGGVGESSTADRLEARKLRDSTLVTADRVVARAAADHGVPDGDCATDLPGVGSWSIDETIVGQAACWIEGADAVVEWSQDRDGLVFRVARANRDEGGVIGLWQQTGLAAWTAAAPSPTGDVFPNAAEVALLGAMPEQWRGTCQRGRYNPLESNNGSRTPIASLECAPGVSDGASSVLVRSFGPEAAKNGYPGGVLSLVGGGGVNAAGPPVPPGDCAVSKRANGRWQRAGTDVGALLCYTESATGDAILWWTYDADALVVKAINQRGDSAALYDWFEQTARFIQP